MSGVARHELHDKIALCVGDVARVEQSPVRPIELDEDVDIASRSCFTSDTPPFADVRGAKTWSRRGP